MRQQINLFHPIFRKEKILFSFFTCLKIQAVFIVGLVFVYATVQMNLSNIDSELAVIKQQNVHRLAQLAKISKEFDQVSGVRGSENYANSLRDELEAGRFILKMFGNVYNTHRNGFSSYLDSFSKHSTQGLWLSSFEMKNGGSSVKITGGSLEPELIPEFISKLSQDSSLIGTRFKLLDIKRKTSQSRWIEFWLSSGDFGKDVFEDLH